MRKIPVNASSDYMEGHIDGLGNMKTMVLTVFTEHPEMSKEEIKKYIEENL